ncbi:hypothetical protein P152DRAFT_306988 [Eremomyces bilateralis CBS 781.70]|uniref:Uncharacterized protein n=1 Tax=Eremomyces bilateralis CBS 781.70 TaxID=1392243 RepID=A0A6G1G5J3_9PEZI|nr:uncharacterized protein P152DRAFT_306988 [Eremomyces bilateralis CBS 781.70]KAF1813160.1 hypothetical protein P152DRAFT_306988 [Eremomyces bilateralis CBS 781.70]
MPEGGGERSVSKVPGDGRTSKAETKVNILGNTGRSQYDHSRDSSVEAFSEVLSEVSASSAFTPCLASLCTSSWWGVAECGRWFRTVHRWFWGFQTLRLRIGESLPRERTLRTVGNWRPMMSLVRKGKKGKTVASGKNSTNYLWNPIPGNSQ